MPILIDWNDGTNPASTFTIPDDAMASLELYRQSWTVPNPPGPPVPKYASLKDMLVGVYKETVMIPALTAYPTPSIQPAMAGVTTAQSVLVAAYNASFTVSES